MADLGLVGDGLPIALPNRQNGLDFDVEGFFHRSIVVKHSLNVKHPFTKAFADPLAMQEKSINEVVAENLSYWMNQAKMTQAVLGEKAGVSQKTISNYLKPEQRSGGSTGKQPSAKLTELDRVSKALHVQLWQLTRKMSVSERQMYEAIEKAYLELRASAIPAEPPTNEPPPALAKIARSLSAKERETKVLARQGKRA
jgi:transcriptional regulator with XRE-family HTH domain